MPGQNKHDKMIKRLLSFFTFLLFVTSCFLITPDIIFLDGVTPEPSFDKNGGTRTIGFKATSNWTAVSSEAWCTVAPLSGVAGEFSLSVKAAANDTPNERIAPITLQCGDIVKTITVSQAQKDQFSLSPESFILESEESNISVDYSGNISVSCRILEGSDWIVWTKALEQGRFTFRVAENKGGKARTGIIDMYNVEAGISEKISIYQKAHNFHKSLIMFFTATWCGWCPITEEMVAEALYGRQGRYEVANFHGRRSNLEFNSIDPLMEEYEITAYPTPIVDGRRVVYTPDALYKAQQETESKYSCSTVYGIRSSFSGNDLAVDVDVLCKEVDSYKLTVLLVEDGIVGYQANSVEGPQDDYHHENVVRMALTNVLGDAFFTVEKNTTKSFSFKVSVPGSYNKENLRVIVYAQREFDQQRRLTDFSKCRFYIDNVASIAVGATLDLP